jgi:hypothetical protein
MTTLSNPWYRSSNSPTRKVNVTNASTTVTGVSTAFTSNVIAGEGFRSADGILYEIASVDSDTQLTLTTAYGGSTLSSQDFVVVPLQAYTRDVAIKAGTLITNYQTTNTNFGTGSFKRGSTSVPGVNFGNLGESTTGFSNLLDGELVVSVSGNERGKFTASGLSVTGNLGLTTAAGSTAGRVGYASGTLSYGNGSVQRVVVNTDEAQTLTNKTLSSPAISGATTLLANSSSAALTVTQTGAGNAFVVEDSASTDSTPFVIDTDGKVGIGVATSFSSSKFSVAGGADALSWFVRNSDDALGYELRLLKNRNSNVYANTIVNSNDSLGTVSFGGNSGTTHNIAALIKAEVDGTPGTNDMPGRLVFSTTADGASSPTERMRIDSAGNVGIGQTPSVGATLSLGKNITGATTSFGVRAFQTVQSDVTANARIFQATSSTVASSFTLANLVNYYASQGTIGATSVVSNQYGFLAETNLTGATNNYGFYSGIASGTGRWNFYAAGTAANYFGGLVDISGASAGQIKFPATQNASADANTLDDYREATATLTATGMTTAPTGTASFVRVGNKVTMEIPYITGTSNATTFTLTGIPTAFRPVAANRVVLCRSEDNGASSAVCIGRVETTGTLVFFKDVAGSAFTNSGAKSSNLCEVSYII